MWTSDCQVISSIFLSIESIWKLEFSLIDFILYFLSRESEERSTLLKQLLDNHVKLQQKWRDTLNETTEKLQKEIIEAQGENSRLIAENRRLSRELQRRTKNWQFVF